MEPIAHSADPLNGIAEQTYKNHVVNVVLGSLERGRAMLVHRRSKKNYRRGLLRILYAAAAFHDLGKLSEGFQRFLKTAGKDMSRHVRHEDAGGVALLEIKETEAAFLVSCHHRGLIDLGFDLNGEVRSSDFRLGEESSLTRSDTDLNWRDYLENHRRIVGGNLKQKKNFEIGSPLTRRLLLSCLVDSDHTDTALHYGQQPEMDQIKGLWESRLLALDSYIAKLECGAAGVSDQAVSERNNGRASFYRECSASVANGLAACEAPVGSGKTTAVMAHLLRAAADKGARHIIVVLPFTNIIRQSVEIYRKALTLPGENPGMVVAEHHHQVEFEDEGLRHLTTLWRSPIIVTTAVQFFETLAACNTSRLRKLHELPGSCVFIDEAHAAMPAPFLPVAWSWMRELQERWNCHFILASGSLAKFWELDSFKKILGTESVAEVSSLGDRSLSAFLRVERLRLEIRSVPQPVDYQGLISKILSVPGPRIAVLNTVQSAATLADLMAAKGEKVLHLSTALAPCHRAIIIDRIKSLLKYQSNWTLVATSLVEAGMDFSFRNGFRQRASTTSLIQLGGRVNRNGEWMDSQLWDFVFSPDVEHSYHPGLTGSIFALGELMKREVFAVEGGWALDRICKEALDIEFSQKSRDLSLRIHQMELAEEYQNLAKHFRIISSDTRTVVVDKQLVRRIESFEKVDPVELIQNSLQLWCSKIESLALPSVRGRRSKDELYRLPDDHDYDPEFLGYMKGVIKNDSAKIVGGYYI